MDERADVGNEPVEVVDAHGRVVDVVARRIMRAERLRHRCTYVVVVDGEPPADVSEPVLRLEERLVAHLRADWKDTHPSHWDLAFGGVCRVGESWEVSAGRELAEEAGIAGAPLHELGPVTFEDETNSVVGRVYLARWSGPLRFVDDEVVASELVPVGDLDRWLSDRPVCSDSSAVIPPLLRAIAR